MAQFLAGERVAVKAAAFVFAVALCVWGAFADAADVNVCATEGLSCGGGDTYIDEASVTDEAVYSCRGVSVGAGASWYECTDGESVVGEYRFVANLEAGDFVLFDTGFYPVEDAAFWTDGVEEETTSSWVPELSVEGALELWGAALLLFAVACIGVILRRAIEKGN